MRQRLVGMAWARGGSLPAIALGASVWAGSVGVAGCAVSESDVHRWETTENGPEKLYAIVAHDKYAWPLREEAALSLIRMRPRNGKRIGLEYAILGYDTPEGKGPGALAVLGDDARRRIVDGIAPKLVEQMQQPPPPPPTEGAVVQPDPSIPYKDAAFALLSHEPPLASNEATKASLIAALSQWVQTDFEDRIDNSTSSSASSRSCASSGRRASRRSQARSPRRRPRSIAPALSSPTSATTTPNADPATRS